MKKMNKKGFTIVELVIVIAVIAILAAVLIPTFSGIIRKAKISNDTNLAKNWNTMLSAAGAIDSVDNFGEVLEAARDADFKIADLNPTADGCYLVWESSTNQMLLVDGKANYKVLFAANVLYETMGDTWYFAIGNKADADKVRADLADKNVNVIDMAGSVSDLNAVINSSGNQNVYIDESIVINPNSTIVLDNADAEVTINLGNNSVSGSNDETISVTNVPFMVNKGSLTLKGGNISAIGNLYDADGKVYNSIVNTSDEAGMVTLDSVNIERLDATLPVAISGEGASISNTTIKANNNAVGAFNGAVVNVINSNVDVDYIAFFSSSSGVVAGEETSKIVINGGTYHATTSNLLTVHGGVIEVKSGMFNCDSAAKTFKFYNVAGSQIVISGGVFNGVAFDNLTAEILEDMCNLSECAAGVTVAKNASGHWVIAINK